MKARTLRATNIEGVEYPVDSVLDLSPRLLRALESVGAIDPHPDAVEYAERELGAVAVDLGGDAPVETATDKPQRKRPK